MDRIIKCMNSYTVFVQFEVCTRDRTAEATEGNCLRTRCWLGSVLGALLFRNSFRICRRPSSGTLRSRFCFVRTYVIEFEKPRPDYIIHSIQPRRRTWSNNIRRGWFWCAQLERVCLRSPPFGAERYVKIIHFGHDLSTFDPNGTEFNYFHNLINSF